MLEDEEDELVPELLATGFETPFVLDGVAPDPEAPGLEVEVAAKGFVLLPPVPRVRSKENVVSTSCCEIDAETSSVFRAEPVFTACVQLLEESVKDIVPPFQLLQLSHRTFATKEPSLFTPEPSSNVTWVSVVCCGMKWPVPSRAESVTLVLSLV